MVKKSVENAEKCACREKDPFVAIPASLGGIYMVIVLLVLLFDSTNAGIILVPVVWAFVVLGFFALLYAYQTKKIMMKKRGL